MQGICLRAYPTAAQKQILSRWMGCARTIWNAKCADNRYMTTFARKYCPINTYAPIDQSYAQYKDRDLTPWLFECPSQVLRNAAVNWYETYQNFMKGRCGKPQHKKKSDKSSILLTAELFEFKKNEFGILELWIGTPKYPLGKLSLNRHRGFKVPRSLRVRKELGEYFVSFCYEDECLITEQQLTAQEQLANLKKLSYEELENCTVGIDRGVVIAAQTPDTSYDLAPHELAKKFATEQYLKRYQRRLAKQEKGSNRRAKTKHKIGCYHQKIRHIRENFCHQTSHAIVSNPDTQVIVLEDLKTSTMTRSAQGDLENPGNNVKAKSGLNRAILDQGSYRLETCLTYKSKKYGKA
jgi:putative transposase